MCMKALNLVWWNVRLKKALPLHPILTMWISVEKALPIKGN